MAASALAACGSGDDGGSTTNVTHPASNDRPSRVNGYEIPRGPGNLAGLLREPAPLYNRPSGRRIARLGRRTRFGSATTLWVPRVRGRGRWLGVRSPATERIAWIDRRRTRVRLFRNELSLAADLSNRTLELRKGSRVVRRMAVTIGNAATPTPTGKFGVTDKIIPRGDGGTYGCCILALSGRQKVLRPGWAGGDRIAIHGSPSKAIGSAASAGCLRGRDSDLRALMKVVLLGTPVTIRA